MLKHRIGILLALLLLLPIVYQTLRWTADPAPNHPFFKQNEFLVIAHRGGDSLGPENTLFTFRKAVDLGVDVLEMDVRTTQDGHLVILHDKSVARTTNAGGEVAAYTLAELKKLDAGYRWSPDSGRTFPLRGRGIAIPTLAEVLAAFPRTRINLEIKDPRSLAIQTLCRRIQAYDKMQTVMVAAFNGGTLKKFRAECPRAATSAGLVEAILFYALQKLYLESAFSPDALALQVPLNYHGRRIVTKRFVDAAHARNLRVHVWTVNDIETMRRLLRIGVDGIMTDYPQRLMELLSAG